MAVLQAVQGDHPGGVVPLDGEVMVFGRHPACDIVLESGAVSRQHAQILKIDGEYYIEDLHSRNGTLLNGEQITQRQLLCDGNHLGICDLEFIFRLGPGELGDVSSTASRDAPTEALMVDDEPSVRSSTIMSKTFVARG